MFAYHFWSAPYWRISIFTKLECDHLIWLVLVYSFKKNRFKIGIFIYCKNRHGRNVWKYVFWSYKTTIGFVILFRTTQIKIDIKYWTSDRYRILVRSRSSFRNNCLNQENRPILWMTCSIVNLSSLSSGFIYCLYWKIVTLFYRLSHIITNSYLSWQIWGKNIFLDAILINKLKRMYIPFNFSSIVLSNDLSL